MALASESPRRHEGHSAQRKGDEYMSDTIEVRVPDIGDFKEVPVIEVLVKAGDRVKKNDSLITLESEKASMEVPAEADGVVQDVKVKVGDKVSVGAPILVLGVEGGEKPGSACGQAAGIGQREAASETAGFSGREAGAGSGACCRWFDGE